MKKITLIILLLIGLSSCKQVNQTNVTDVHHSLVLEANKVFNNDSTKNVTIIHKDDFNYVFERNKDYPILKSYTNYYNIYLTIFIFTVMVFSTLVINIMSD